MKRDPEHYTHFSFFINRHSYLAMCEIKKFMRTIYPEKQISFPTIFEFAIDALKRELAIDPVQTARPVIDDKAKILKVWGEKGKSYYQAYDIIGKKPNRKLKKVAGFGVFGYKVKEGKYKI